MPKEQSFGNPTTRRYSPEEKSQAVRLVRTLWAELGTEHGTVQRVAHRRGGGRAPPGSPPRPTARPRLPPGCATAGPRPGDKWHLDEVVVRINGVQHYLRRAVDQDGTVLDVPVQRRRHAKAAKKFFRKLLKGLRYIPRGHCQVNHDRDQLWLDDHKM